MGNYYQHTFRVASSEIDIWGHLKIPALLSICQDVAYAHSAEQGLGFDTLVAQNMAWVLSRIDISIERLPVWNQTIKVRTWHKGQSGLFSLRDYIFFDSDDNPIIHVTSSWLIINLSTRRISRVDKVFNQHNQLTLAEYNYNAIEGEAPRIELNSNRVSVGEHRVVYSDIDLNRHVNNTKYVEWACDHSPYQMQEEMALRRLSVNFNHEAKYGQTVALSTTDQSQNEFIVEGSIDQRNIFALAMKYTHKA